MLELTCHGLVTQLALNRPEKRNALTIELCHRIREAIEAATDAGTRVLVITGHGGSFCAGADFGEVYTDGFREALYSMLEAVTRTRMPVLAAVNGPAIGSGTQLALAADLRIAAPTARFAIPTAAIGLAVDPWTIRRLAALAGNGTARAMLLACESLDAEAARGCGLAQRCGGLADALAWAGHIAALAPLSLAYSKQVLNDDVETRPETQALLDAFETCWESRDLTEARQARAENRQPVFEGR
jgi:enoyl-CoA hydratase